MTVYTREQVIAVARRTGGEGAAQALHDRLPERVDLDDEHDVALLRRLGLTPDTLYDDLGAQL